MSNMKTDLLDIRNCDCMDLMREYPDNHFELTIVDPPYGLGDFRQRQTKKFGHKEVEWNDEIPTAEYFQELERVTVNRIIWGINYYTEHVKDTGRIIHDKTGRGMKPQLPQMSEADLASHSFGVNIRIFHYIWQGNVQGLNRAGRPHWNVNNAGRDGRVHPCQKPVSLYEWLLKEYAKEGDKILDTHMGSGSIAIACHYMGFNLTACELDEDYYTAACERIERETAQLEMPLS